MQLTLRQLKSKLEFRNPTEEELAKINQWRPRGSPEYDANELLTVPILASNNLLHSELMKWDLNAIESMVASYYGKDFMLNHDWMDVKQTFGFIYDAELWHIPRLSSQQVATLINLSPNPEVDKETLTKEGYYQVILYGAIEASHPIASEIRYRRKSDISVGGYFHGDWICPLCQSSFSDKACKHYPPSWLASMLVAFGEIEPEDVAPYYIRSGRMDSVEVSLVFAGACKEAGIISENLINLIIQ